MNTRSGIQRKVAAFDIDGTIFRSSLLIEVVEMLIRKKIFNSKARTAYLKEQQAWNNREGGYEDYITAVVDVFMKHIKGVAYQTLVTAGKEVALIKAKCVYRYTRDLIKTLREKGYFIIAISHSPKLILDFFCRPLGFDKVYGLKYEVDQHGRFTGKVMDPDLMFNKAAVLSRAVEKEKLTLRGSYGVGDTESDISFLQMAAHPICFNPNHQLYMAAKKKDGRLLLNGKMLFTK